MKTKKLKTKFQLPKILEGLADNRKIDNFPLDHYSYSSLVRFSTNPILFKIRDINGDQLDTTWNISGVIGQAFHKAMQEYYLSMTVDDEPTAIQTGLEAGMDYLEGYNDGFIEFSFTVPNKQKAQEILAFAYNSYVKETKNQGELVSCEEKIEVDVDVEWKGERVKLPVALKGYVDKIIRQDGKLKIVDYKTTRAFSNPDKIDGAKIIQAIQYYLLVFAEYGEAPYSIVFEEIKTSKNRDGGSQVKRYEMIYGDCEQFFDFYFRLYDDVTRAINGEAVFVPNVHAVFDNEVALVAYIHRLDVTEEAAKLMKKLRVRNITDLLKRKITTAGNMRRFLATAEKKFVSFKNLNYEKMTTEEKIKTKLMEHGMLVDYESKIDGYSVELYQFNPSIGLKMSRIKSYVADVEQVVGVSGVRVLAPIPNTSLIGFEIPKTKRSFPKETPHNKGFELAIGADIYGKPYYFDIRKAPHLLVAGASGSGKSVFLNSIISQLATLDNVDLHLFDPKIVELARFSEKAKEYYTDVEDVYLALDGLIDEMNKRYQKFRDSGARNIEEYTDKMNYKFVIIDEFGDLTVGSNYGKEISKTLLILAQKARAAGIHLIIATQRPSAKIITGDIKANFPAKAAFRCAKAIDSQVVLDEAGAEKLLGQGDMIFSSDQGEIRLQGYNA